MAKDSSYNRERVIAEVRYLINLPKERARHREKDLIAKINKRIDQHTQKGLVSKPKAPTRRI